MTRTMPILLVVALTLVATSAAAQVRPARPSPTAVPEPAIPQPAPSPQGVPVPPAAPASPWPLLAVPVPAPQPAWRLELPFDAAALQQSLAELNGSLDRQRLELGFAAQDAQPFLFAQAPAQAPRPFSTQAEALYDQARSLIERDQYDRALPVLDRVIGASRARVDAAMYWKAYSLSKLARRPEALTVIADLQKQFPGSAWVRDARALEVEIRQASGQRVSADVADDEVKLLALRGVMQNDPETAVPIIEKMLQGDSSVRVKERALFVLSQSRAARAREILSGAAMNASNPDLRRSALRYLAVRSDPESLKILSDVYASTSDVDMKRTILRSFISANARDRLMAVARTEPSPELRVVAIQQLGAVRAAAELEELYRTEQNRDVKQRILQSFVAANAPDRLAAIARSEKDPDLQRLAIRNLGTSNRPEATEALRAIYRSDVPVETRKAVIDGLFIHQNCSVLVDLAKAETDAVLRTEIVRRLSMMTNRCAEARDYMVELLK